MVQVNRFQKIFIISMLEVIMAKNVAICRTYYMGLHFY